MALEALSSNEFLNFIIYDTISATPQSSSLDSLENSTTSSFLFGGTSTLKPQEQDSSSTTAATTAIPLVNGYPHQEINHQQQGRLNGLQEERVVPDRRREGLGVQGIRKRRRRKPRVCKNKEEAETQRMTHISVERNRRKQMNEHLTVLRSLMPESYVQRGDQASIVGGAIEFVKELEHLLQSLEAQKLHLLQRLGGPNEDTNISTASLPPFAQFFPYPQYTWSQVPGKFTSKTKASIADIEVTLIETHANMRILSRRIPRQLSKLVAGFQTLHLSILHINVSTVDPLVLFSISAKLEEGCQLATVDDIAGAVHHMLRIIEEDTALC